MTLTADTAHKTELIDKLILDAIYFGNHNFDDVFMHVAKRYSLSNSQGFLSVVEKRFTSLRRRDLIVYNRRTKAWTASGEENN